MERKNKTPPLISVILPTYNTGIFIEKAVKSILNQTYKNIELIVVDDGSTDNTKDILEKYMSQITYIHQKNTGPSEARNTGIKMSHGQLIAYQDADDISSPNRIEQEVTFLLNNSDCSMVYTGMVNIYVDGHIEKRPAIPYNTFLLLQNNYIPCGTVMHWKNVFDEINIWNENIDWDLWIRISETFKIGYIEECLYKHTICVNSVSSTRGRFKNRLIDLNMFKDRYNRKKEWWMALKVKRIAFECEILKRITFKNKRIEIVFWYGVHNLANMIEKTVYRIEYKLRYDKL